ncbi:hypothetical protein ACET3Z_024423 [Daucus carota]
MELKLIFISFALISLRYANAVCVPRDNAASHPNPHAPPNLRPVSVNAVAESDPAPAPMTPAQSGVVDAVLGPQPQANGNENPEVKRICDATDYPDVCQAVFNRYSGPTDFVSLLNIAIGAGLDIARAATGTAENMSTQQGAPTDHASVYSDCKDSYDSASIDFQNALDALPVKDVGTLNTMLSAAITDASDCQDSLEGMDSPLNLFSEKLRKMASNCLAMVTHMQQPGPA